MPNFVDLPRSSAHRLRAADLNKYIDSRTVNVLGLAGGASDDTALLQAAINATLNGQRLILPAGTFRISSTLQIGNGSSSIMSTIYGVMVCGSGPPGISPAIVQNVPTTGGTRLIWTGGPAPMIQINGPLYGWGLEDLYLDGGGAASHGIKVMSGSSGRCTGIVVDNVAGQAILEATYTTVTGIAPHGCIHNRWSDISINVPVLTSPGTGIALTGTPAMGSNSCYGRWDNITVCLPHTGPAFGVYLQWVDSHLFTDLHIINANPSATSIFFDYASTSDNSLPGGNGFVGLDVSTASGGIGFGFAGTPDTLHKPNYIRGQSEVNGGYPPIDIPNLVPDLPQVLRRISANGITAPISPQALFYPFTDGLFRASFYVFVRGTASSGTITGQIVANSRGATVHCVTPDIPVSVSGVSQFTIFFQATAGVPVTYEIDFTGTSAAPTYDLAILLERVG